MAQGSIHTAKRTRYPDLTSPKVKVDVTQEMIDAAIPRDSSHCMIADAVKAAVPNAKYVSVDLATIRFTDLEAGMRYIYLTPRRPQVALLDFDQGDKPDPFTFTIQGAHIMPTGNARKARATLKPQKRNGTTVPTRIAGQAPPVGPLPGGAPENRKGSKGKNAGAGAGNTTGKRREFGLRSLIR